MCLPRVFGFMIASLLALTCIATVGFCTTASAAAWNQPHSPNGATGSGVNAPPAGSQPFAPGLWDAKNYRIPHHAKFCPQPPKSDSERLALINSPLTLTYFGLPTLANESGNLAKWQDIVLHMRTQVCDSTTPIKNGKPIYNNGGTTWNHYWGGWGNQCTSGCYSYQAADAQFYVPAIVASANTSDSIWVGTGGANANALSQAGVSEDSWFGTNSYNAFYEYVPAGGGGQGEQDAFGVSPGDYMYVYTDRNGNDTLDDYTKGVYKSYPDGYSSADTAEFIIERNGLDNTDAALADYHSLTWYYAEFEDASNTWRRVDSQGSLYQWWLTNYQGRALETQGTISNDSYGSQWTETWQNGN